MDILFSEKLVAFLASGKLRQDCFYQVSRYDVGTRFLGDTVEEQNSVQSMLRILASNSTCEIAKKKTFGC
jgi:hypothetical protein